MRKRSPRADEHGGHPRVAPTGRPRPLPVSEVAAVWLLPLLGVAVLALVWLV